jgi:hypothetical protein
LFATGLYSDIALAWPSRWAKLTLLALTDHIHFNAQHMHVGLLEVAVSNGLGRTRRRVFPAGVILVYKTCSSIRANLRGASASARRSCRVSRVPQRRGSEHAGLVGCRGDLSAGSEKRSPARLADAAWMEGVAGVSTNETRRFQPGSWRADGFLRCVVWGTSFLHVCALGRDCPVVHSSGLALCMRPVFLQSLGGWSSGFWVLYIHTLQW